MIDLITKLGIEVRDLKVIQNSLADMGSADNVNLDELYFLSDQLQSNIDEFNRLYSALEGQDGFEADLIEELGIEICHLEIDYATLVIFEVSDNVTSENLQLLSRRILNNVEGLTKIYKALAEKALPEAIKAKLDGVHHLQFNL